MTGQTPPTNGADLTDTTGRPAGPVAATIAATIAAAVEPRRVPLPSGPINLRDVGGYPTADGRTVRWRTLLRAGSLHGLDSRGRAVLAQIGLRTVVDLREDAEVTRAPDQLGRLAVEHRRIPVYTLPVTRQRTADDGAGGSASVGSFTATEAIRAASASGDLGSIYDHIVDHLGARLTAAVLALAAPDALPAIVHCSAGKDRTGLVIALVLDLVGVPAEVIAQDFALTSYFLRDEAAATVQRMSSWLSAEGTPLPPALLDSPPELILRSLARIRTSHGGTRAYLLAHGATGHALDRLVEALLVPADTPASRLERALERTSVPASPDLTAYPPTHTLIQISDTHIVREDELLHGKIDSYATLRTVLEQIEAAGTTIDALLLTGDLADSGDLAAYQRLRDLVEPVAARLGAPVLYAVGNHDSRGPFRAGLLGAEPTAEPYDHVHWIDDLRVIVLDTTRPGRHSGALSTAQLRWLADELATPAAAGTVLALHHPPVPSPISLVNALLLAEPEKLADVLAGSDVKILLAGHAHHSSAGAIGAVPVWVAGSSAYRAGTIGPTDRFTGLAGGEYTRVDVYPAGAVATAIPIADTEVIYDRNIEEMAKIASAYA